MILQPLEPVLFVAAKPKTDGIARAAVMAACRTNAMAAGVFDQGQSKCIFVLACMLAHLFVCKCGHEGRASLGRRWFSQISYLISGGSLRVIFLSSAASSFSCQSGLSICQISARNCVKTGKGEAENLPELVQIKGKTLLHRISSDGYSVNRWAVFRGLRNLHLYVIYGSYIHD